MGLAVLGLTVAKVCEVTFIQSSLILSFTAFQKLFPMPPCFQVYPLMQKSLRLGFYLVKNSVLIFLEGKSSIAPDLFLAPLSDSLNVSVESTEVLF